MVVGDNGEDLASVDHADVDFWVATMIWPRCETRRCTITGPGDAGRSVAARLAPRRRYRCPIGTGHGKSTQGRAVVADDGHLGAFHPQRDPLTSQLEADFDLDASEAGQAAALTMADHVDLSEAEYVERSDQVAQERGANAWPANA